MRALVTSFVSGIVFALGLGISGMTRPVKVIGFLDFFSAWDPSLAFVMIGAISVYFVANQRRRTMASPLFTAKFEIPSRSDLDRQLVVGATLFGVGWGPGRLLSRARNRFTRLRRGAGSYFHRFDDLGNVATFVDLTCGEIGDWCCVWNACRKR